MTESKEKNFISAVVHLHNDGGIIAEFIEKLNRTLAQLVEKYEIICVNDGSSDNSREEIKKIGEKLNGPEISIINMSFYQGVESAMNAGVDMAIGDFVFEFDTSHMDYDEKLIKEVYYRSLSGYDIVSARSSKERLSSFLFYWLYNGSTGSKNKLGTESFRILSRRAINRVHSMSKSIPYRKALYANCGLKSDCITYEPNINDKSRHTKLQNKTRQDTAFTTLILFTNVAYKISMGLTLLMMLATLGGVIYTVTVFALGKPIAGYTTIMLVLTGSFFCVFALFAIIIKYLSVLIDLIFKQQKYMIESIEKI